MKRVKPIGITVAALVCVVAAMASFAVAGEGHDHGKMKEVTVVGTLIGTKCYGMNHDNLGDDHMTPKGEMPGCATACAKMGIPVGVLTDGKKGNEVYVLITPSMALADYMAREVKVTGPETYNKAIIPNQVWVKNDSGEWEEVKIATMM